MKHSNFKKSAGLTMIELVISLFVLTVAVIGVYNGFSIMVVATAQMSDRFTASVLWPNRNGSVSGRKCVPLTSMAKAISPKGFYYYDLSNPNKTKFTREITVTPITDVNGETYILKVAVTVFWDEKATIFNFEKKYGSITTEDYLYNWY
ncbi:MAG: hypothetical protein US35_C0018G0022 [Parcubacteria group bacterium GW2011_GWA2_37_10]|nr:MAG: hypothetical protein US35_C0018G0022 [Parcubacteria group bacterium GW2011_GWA2_37_10]